MCDEVGRSAAQTFLSSHRDSLRHVTTGSRCASRCEKFDRCKRSRRHSHHRGRTSTCCCAARWGLAQDAKAQAGGEAKLELGDLIKRANQSVVLINIENKSGQKVGFGTGFLVDDKGLVATNLHVVARAAKADVLFEFKDGNRATGQMPAGL